VPQGNSGWNMAWSDSPYPPGQHNWYSLTSDFRSANVTRQPKDTIIAISVTVTRILIESFDHGGGEAWGCQGTAGFPQIHEGRAVVGVDQLPQREVSSTYG
jgi:hypothetical protein